MKKTLLILFLCFSIMAFSQSFSTGEVQLLTNLSAKIDIDGPSETTTLTLEGPSNAWFAIGFGALNMTNGADVFRTDGTVITDARSTGRFLPTADASQDWVLESNTVSGGTRTIVATRANNTGDSDDFVFDAAAGSIPLIYAHGSTSTYAYHGATRGFTTVGVTLGISEAERLDFSMYPNPVSDVLNIQLPTGTTRADVGVFDYTGRRIAAATVTVIDNQVNVSNLATGMYIIRVLADDKIGAQKFRKKISLLF